MSHIRCNFVVHWLVIPLGGQDAGEGIGDLVYEARAVLNVKSNSNNCNLQRIRRPVESEIFINQQRASWSFLTLNVILSMYGRNFVTLHTTEYHSRSVVE